MNHNKFKGSLRAAMSQKEAGRSRRSVAAVVAVLAIGGIGGQAVAQSTEQQEALKGGTDWAIWIQAKVREAKLNAERKAREAASAAREAKLNAERKARAGEDDGGASKRAAAAAARDADIFTTTNDEGEEQSFTRAEAAAAVEAGFDGDYQNAATPEEAAKRLAEAVRRRRLARPS